MRSLRDNSRAARRQRGGSGASAGWLVAGCLALLVFAGVAAAEPFRQSNPFAEHFIVLQISDGDPARQAMVLGVAYNLLEHYGPDLIDIVIVAFGPGIDVVMADYDQVTKVNSLVAQGVHLVGCMNTIETITRNTGVKPELNPHMIPVQTGVAHILELVEQGYTLVRP